MRNMLSFGSLAIFVAALFGTVWWVSRDDSQGSDS
jgi:hypothetical protein